MGGARWLRVTCNDLSHPIEAPFSRSVSQPCATTRMLAIILKQVQLQLLLLKWSLTFKKSPIVPDCVIGLSVNYNFFNGCFLRVIKKPYMHLQVWLHEWLALFSASNHLVVVAGCLGYCAGHPTTAGVSWKNTDRYRIGDDLPAD